MTKHELRIKYKTLRSSLSEEEIEDLSLKIANNTLGLPIWDKKNYHIFMPITENKEVNIALLLQVLMGKEKNIIVSATDFKTQTMRHFLLTEDTVFKKNNYNIPEPVENSASVAVQPNEIEVVFVPLLAFDNQGNRVGYGKGFYDTFLATCKPDVITIGVSFFEPEKEPIETNPTDYKLNYCVTPRKSFKF